MDPVALLHCSERQVSGNIMKYLRIVCYFFPLFLLNVTAEAQSNHFYYFRPENNFGSDAKFNPATYIINGGFDILRNGGHTKDIRNLHISDGFDNVMDNILHPGKHIKKFGWDNFLEREILNLTLNKTKAQFVPNISNHVFGNGMLYVKLTEYYRYHGIKYPVFSSIVTTTFYQILNESVENGNYRGTNVDPISDLLIFNPIGIIFFSFESVKRLFSETFSMNDWPLQPILNPENRFLENTGQQYVMKYRFPKYETWGCFLYWGLNGIGGITYNYEDGRAVSVGLGTYVNKLHEKTLNGGRFLTPGTDGALGIFYDKNNSLLASAIFTAPRLYNVRINVYPGFCHFRNFSPGFFVGAGEWDKFIFGISCNVLPVGLAFGNR